MRKLLFLALLAITTSCVTTKAIWKGGYYDSVAKFVLTEDGSQIILIGKEYHYAINDNTGKMVNLLIWEGREGLYVDLSRTYVKVGSGNNVEGNITIRSIAEVLSPEVYNYLISLGFIDNGRDNLYLQLRLQGKRYLPIKNLNFQAANLNKKYNLRIKTSLGPVDKLGRAIITPFTLIIDVFIFPFVHNW